MEEKSTSEGSTQKGGSGEKDNKILLIVGVVVVLCIAAAAVYFLFFNGKDLDIFGGGSCTQDGIEYSDGDSVPSKDSCNTCSCVDGEITCTLMACDDETYDEPEDSDVEDVDLDNTSAPGEAVPEN